MGMLEEEDFLEGIVPWSHGLEDDGANEDAYLNHQVGTSPMQLKNWRQLFNQDELNRAYQQSINAYHNESSNFEVAIKVTDNDRAISR